MSIFQMCLYFVLSLSIVLVTMPFLIQYLKKLSFKQTVSEYALEDDKKKAGTPIMGGILFIIVPVVLTLIFVKGIFQDLDTLIVLLVFMGYGLIGFVDDFLIAVLKNNEGLKPLHKFLMQVLLAVIFFVLYRSHASLEITLPITRIVIPLGIAYFFLVLFMFAGSSNAVNLTDGMDGLSSGVSIIALIPYLVITLKQEKIGLAIFVVCLIGALLGYLYYNKKPARVFMGDTGSLALGGVLAALAMITKTELLLILIAGVPVIETLCVMIQIGSVKIRHKKVFPYTPIHYAFRIKGMPEVSIVRMFWLVEAILAGIGLLIGIR